MEHTTENPNRVAVLRKRLGLSQVELAGKIGVTRDTISKMENGHLDLKVSRLEQLAGVLGCSCAYLLGEDVPPPMIPKYSIRDLNSAVTIGGNTLLVAVDLEGFYALCETENTEAEVTI